MENQYLTGFNIAGFRYYDGTIVFEKLKIGTRLKLKPEPNNAYDPKAVALYYKKTKLGYVPRGENKLISQMLNLGYKGAFMTIINRISPGEHPESQVGVAVKVREKK